MMTSLKCSNAHGRAAAALLININTDGHLIPVKKCFRSSNKVCAPRLRACCMLPLPIASALPYLEPGAAIRTQAGLALLLLRSDVSVFCSTLML